MVDSVGKIHWNLLKSFATANDYWTTSEWGFKSENIGKKRTEYFDLETCAELRNPPFNRKKENGNKIGKTEYS